MIKKIRNVLILIGVVAVVIAPFFIRVKVECKSQYGACPSELNLKLQTLNNKYLFQARGDVLRILKSNSLISDFSLQFKLPNVLMANVLVKKIRYSIFSKNTNEYFMLDAEGDILSKSTSSSFPTIYKNEVSVKVGEKVSNSDLFALRIVEGVNNMYQINSGVIDNDLLVVDMNSGIRVIFPVEERDLDVLLGSLRLIYSKISTDYPGKYSQIDMRYKNPVLR
jgi:hypothetical protein